MAKKGNQAKSGLEQHLPNGTHSVPTDNSINDTSHVQEVKKSKKKTKKSQKKESKLMNEAVIDQEVSPCNNSAEKSNAPAAEAFNITTDRSTTFPDESLNSDSITTSGNLPNGLHTEDPFENVQYPETPIFRFIRTAALSAAKASAEWVERQKPTCRVLTNYILEAHDLVQVKIQLVQPILFQWILILKMNVLMARDHARMKIRYLQPILFKWTMYIGNLMLLLFMVWLDCTLRGIDSLRRIGTTSFFSIVWCSLFSVFAMVGISKFLIILVVAAAVGLFLGFILGLVLLGIAATVLLWIYGSFWTTGFTILLGGLTFMAGRDRAALFIMSVYSAYCAWNYVGFLGLVLCLNLSFISSDVLLYFLRNVKTDQRRPNRPPPHAAGMEGGQSSFSPKEWAHASSGESGVAGERSSGVASTSGAESELTSEDEIFRLLNCVDHYAALGLTRFGEIDASFIKREYRKKAMLVHPDKNMGNENAAEAFKKLQNAYEVLLDSSKCKEYDDELRKEELVDYFRKFQNRPVENKRRGVFHSHMEADDEDPMGESRRIACKKCGSLHFWVYTNKPKSRARWCQECKDFHQAKDGDGWVEQSSQPFLFGMLQKVDAPSAYVCADGKIYDATEWYICQGLRCHVNSHKPTFQVNTNVMSKNAYTKGTNSGQKGGIPTPNNMEEEELFEWLQNAMQNGMFENVPGSSESPTGFNPKNSGSAGSKRKKKGKKQW